MKRSEPWGAALKGNVRRGFALKHLPHKGQLPTFVAIADAIANHALAEHGRQLGRKIAHLIRMRKKHQIRLCRADYLRQRYAISIRRVRLQQIVFDQQHVGNVLRREFAGQPTHAFADHQSADRTRSVLGDLLRRCQGLEARIVPLALPLFCNHQNFHYQITRASNFSFSTNLAATSLGVPVKNSVFFVLVGT